MLIDQAKVSIPAVAQDAEVLGPSHVPQRSVECEKYEKWKEDPRTKIPYFSSVPRIRMCEIFWEYFMILGSCALALWTVNC